MDPIYPYMAHSMAPSSGSQGPWHTNSQGKLLLVHCRHPWSCQPRSSIMHKASSCEDELYHHCYPTQYKTSKTLHLLPQQTAVKTTAAPAAAKPIRSTDDLMKEFPDWFTGIGRFPGEYAILLHHDVHPVIHTLRKCPIALHPRLKEHLDRMDCLGVITHVDEPTDWLSSITYLQKANGKLCLCLDPCDLNKAICHDHHKMPTLKEVAHELAHSHYFTKLDAHHGYWLIILDQKSSLLTTFNSPLWKIPFPASSLWPCLLSRHLLEEDGPDPRRVSRMHWDCRWHHCPWLHQSRTWCPSTEPQVGCLQILLFILLLITFL